MSEGLPNSPEKLSFLSKGKFYYLKLNVLNFVGAS